MDGSIVQRFCELKVQQKKLDEELEILRKQIIAAFPEDAEVRLDDYTFKIIYQEKKHYDDQLLLAALPDPELWKVLFKPDTTKISALLKAQVLHENDLEGTYRTTRTPHLYVQP